MPRNYIEDSTLERLIELVRKNPPIYDTSSKEHKDAIRTTNFWDSIASIIDLGAEFSEFLKFLGKMAAR